MSSILIDEIFKNFRDIDKLIEIANIEVDYYQSLSEEKYNYILRRIMQRIEANEEDYKYFSQYRANPKYAYAYIRLLCQSSRVDDIKQYIKDREIMPIYTGSQLTELIKATRDKEYIVYCVINRREEFELYNWYLIQLLKALGEEYIKDCINGKIIGIELSHEELVEAIKLADKRYIEDCIDNRRDEFGLNHEEIIELIKATKDEVYIENCIDNRRGEFGFYQSDIIELIKLTSKEYIRSCIENKIEGLNLSYSDKHKIMYAIIEDKEYIGNCIEKRRKELDLDISDIMLLIKHTEKRSTASEYIDRFYRGIQTNENLKSQINLPANMSIGVEIESEGIYSCYIRPMTDVINIGWECKEDASLIEDMNKGGVEVVSPVLHGSNENDLNGLNKVCTLLKEFRQKISPRCGGHIHIGADYLTSVQAWKNLIELCSNTEEILYIISNKPGEIPRKGILNQAKPISTRFKESLDNGSINLENETDLDEFIKEVQNIQGTRKEDRFYGINFQNIGTDKYNTVEFRIPNGTLDTEIWVQNINLFGGIMKAAEELSIIQKKPEEQRTEEEKRKLQYFEGIRSGKLEGKEKVQALVEIAVQENQREIYIERYDVNSQLLQEEPEFYQQLKEKISEGRIRLTKEKIGKVIFTNQDKPNGVDYIVTTEVIGSVLENQLIGNIQE